MTKEKAIKLEIVNATALEKDKYYIIELNRTSFTAEHADNLQQALTKAKIHAVIGLSNDGQSISVKEVQ